MSITGNTSQTDVVIDGIKRMIVRGEIEPNARLPIEKDLAEALGVSRSSLREGVRALSLLGVVESRQGAGTFVTGLDPSLLLAQLGFVVDLQHAGSAVHLHLVRRVLETEAAGQAALRITGAQLDELDEILDRYQAAIECSDDDHHELLDLDIRFHRIIAEATGNPVLSAMIEGFSGRTAAVRYLRAVSDERAESRTLAEHRAIARALSARTPDRASVRMADHLLALEDYLREA